MRLHQLSSAPVITVAALLAASATWVLTSESNSATPDQAAVFIGDSYTAGFGATEPKSTGRWSKLVADQMGWQEVNVGRGGTGYQTTTISAGCGESFCPSYLGMLPEITAGSPDVIVVSGGRNDKTADVGAAADQLFKNISLRFPDAEKYVTSPVWDAGPTPPFITEQTTVVKDAAERNGFVFLDVGQPLANRPDLIADDELHPNDAGHAALANAVLTAIDNQQHTDNT